MTLKIGVVGLGYVGLPVAIFTSRKFPGTVGFDISRERIAELRRSVDRTGEVSSEDLKASALVLSDDPNALADVNFFIIAVPTPVDDTKRPDLGPLKAACEIVGKILRKNSIVVFESTVYPGVTEEICGPLLSKYSGLQAGRDFKLGYSPERINPGDRERTLDKIPKVVAGEDPDTLEIVSSVYAKFVTAGIHRAPSIKVAEAAKVIENTQRDINIALINEFALIFDRMNIRTADVLKAAQTKWNFLPFQPGLVGGHCIGVDPYYLTCKAEELDYHPQVILSGRRINDGMGKFISEKVVKLLGKQGCELSKSRVGILGITFKENVSDIRNSRVPDIAKELREYGVESLIGDCLADGRDIESEYGINLTSEEQLRELDAVILAVPHREYLSAGAKALSARLRNGKGIVIDVKSVFSPREFSEDVLYWSL